MSAKVCPREPTPEMLKALGNGFSADDRDVMRGRAWDYWTTMYDAVLPQADAEARLVLAEALLLEWYNNWADTWSSETTARNDIARRTRVYLAAKDAP